MRPAEKRIVLPCLLMFAVLLLAGCAGMSSRVTPAQQAAVQHASSLRFSGELKQAAAAWQNLAAQYPHWRDEYLLNAAESYRQLDDWSAAAPVLSEIRRSRLNADDAIQYDLLRASSALANDDPATALQLTANSHSLPKKWQLRALEVHARAQAASGQPLAAARSRLGMNASLGGYARSQNEQQILTLLESVDNSELQSSAAALDANDPMRAWIAEALKNKGSALASTLPQLQNPVGTLLQQSGSAVSAEGYAPPQKVALILPTSGPLAVAGGAVQDGFNTAWKLHPDQSARMQLDVLDTSGTPTGATQAYQQAVASGADLVVGPLAPASVATLFQRAQLSVPLLALNHPDQGLPPEGSAEFALPPEADGVQIAARMNSQGLREAVLFLADASSAQRAARAFRAQFESHGGNIIGTATLARNEVNYADAINALMAEAGPDTGVFIAMPPQQGRLLVPQLRIAKITQPLFATSHIYGVESNPGLDRDLDGVVFCDSPWLFDAQAGLPKRSKLAETNPNAQGPAARLFAFGMDAWALMPYLKWLRQHPGSYLSGATGQLTMDSFGRIHRNPIWARFVNGIAVPVTGGLDVNNATAQPLDNADLKQNVSD